MTEHKRVDLDEVVRAGDWATRPGVVHAMIHELRLLRQLDRYYSGWCMGCGHNPGHTDDCPVKQLEATEGSESD